MNCRTERTGESAPVTSRSNMARTMSMTERRSLHSTYIADRVVGATCNRADVHRAVNARDELLGL